MSETDKNGQRRGLWKRPPTMERFWAKVSKGAENECWLWKRPNCYGYGFFWHVNRNWQAHRFIYEFTFGPVSPELIIRHKCDNSACVNPSHLEPGTQQDNVKDRVSRGRTNAPKGSRSGHAKLTESDVLFIRENYVRRKVAPLLSRFQISRSTLQEIINRETWRHI